MLGRPLRVGLVSGPAPGHLLPVLGLAQALQEAGHQPVVITGWDWLERIEARGLAARPLPRLDPGHPHDDIGWRLIDLPALLAPEIAPTLRQEQVDVVVCDLLSTAGGWAAELVGVPWLRLVPGCVQEPSRHLAPYGSGLRVPRGPWERITARWLNRLGDGDRAGARARVAVVRGWLGLPPTDGYALQLVATLPALEPARPDWPARSPVVGPLWWDPATTDLPVPPGDAPLVVVSGSTAAVTASDLLRLAADGLPGARLAVTSLDAVEQLPPGVVAGPGRQAPLLAEAVRTGGLVLTHGGHGMIAKALAHGLPVVSAPGQGDQRGNAARLAATGAGLVLAESGLTSSRLATAVRQVLADRAYREAARRAHASLAGLGPQQAVCWVQQVAADAAAGQEQM